MPSPPRTRWAWSAGTVLGIGYLRPGPGTYGSAAALLLWYAAAHVLQPTPAHLALGTLLAAGVATAIGIPAATIVARECGLEDPGCVVIDEVAGQLLAVLAIHPDWTHAALALMLFRILDILKPPPIRQLEQLPGGTGIMLDDLAAGLGALALGLLAQHFF